MRRGIFIFLGIAILAVCVVLNGCRARTEEGTTVDMASVADETTVAPMTEEQLGQAQEPAGTTVVETIPPSASAPTVREKPAASISKTGTEKDIQTALKNAGLYTGAIDGKVGPKTKKAIEDFQREKGLKVDGKVGPRTWAELEKYLAR